MAMATAELTLSTFTAAGPPSKISADRPTSSRTFEAPDAYSWRASHLRDLDSATPIEDAHFMTVQLSRYIVSTCNLKTLAQVFPNSVPGMTGFLHEFQDLCGRHHVLPSSTTRRWSDPDSHRLATLGYLLGLTYTEDIQWLGGPRLNDRLRVPASILEEPIDQEGRVRSRLGDVFAGHILLHAQHCSDRIYLVPQ